MIQHTAPTPPAVALEPAAAQNSRAAALGERDEATTGFRPYRQAAFWKVLFGSVTREGALALVDQGVVSGIRFFTMVLLGRVCGAEELGIYSLGFTLVVLIACVQESLISVPYTIYGNRLQGDSRAAYAGSVLVQHVILALMAMTALATAGTILAIGFGPAGRGPVLWVLALAMPWNLLWEFARRLAFAHLRILSALGMDLAVAAIQGVAVGGLVFRGTLSAGAVYAVMGFACAVPGLTWLLAHRRWFRVCWRQVAQEMRRNWSFGKWVFATQMTSVVHGYLIHWLLATMLAPRATGIFSACMMVVSLAHPFVLGICNVLGPWVASAFARGGAAEVHRVVWRATWFLLASLAVLCGILVLAGDEIVRGFYGPEFAGNRHAISVLACTILASGVSMAAGCGLWALERPDVICKSRILAVCVTLTGSLCLLPPLGMLGTAYALLAGSTLDAAVSYLCYLSVAGAVSKIESSRAFDS